MAANFMELSMMAVATEAVDEEAVVAVAMVLVVVDKTEGSLLRDVVKKGD
jgi:hypothetical protein